MRMCDLLVQSARAYKNLAVRMQYVHTLLLTKFTSRTPYAEFHARLESEVYFVLKDAVSCVSILRPGEWG